MNCKLCSNHIGYTLNAHALDYSDSNSYNVCFCENCNIAYTNCSGADFEYLYNNGQYNFKKNRIVEIIRPFFYIAEIFKAVSLRFSIKNVKLLEIGCGKGFFLSAAKVVGFNAFGIEPSRRSYKFAKSLHGENVKNTFLENYFNENSVKYDIIYAFHVLEHVEDPHQFLYMISQMLEPNGYLCISVPNYNSLQFKLFKDRWYHLDVPRHLNHFTHQSLSTILNRSNLNIYKKAFFSLYFEFIGYFISLYNYILPINNFIFNIIKCRRILINKFGILSVTKTTISFILLLPIVFSLSIIFTLLTFATPNSGTINVLVKRNNV